MAGTTERVLGYPPSPEAGHQRRFASRRGRPAAGVRRDPRGPADGCHVRPDARGRLDVIVFFVTRRAELVRRFPGFARALESDGGLWVAWPKQTSGVATDLGFDAVQSVGLAPVWSTTRSRRSTARGRACGSSTGWSTAGLGDEVPRGGQTGDMCGRFVSVSSPQLLVDRFGVQEAAVVEHDPDYNVTPRALGPAVRVRRRRDGEGDGQESATRVLSMLRWGSRPVVGGGSAWRGTS